MQTKVTAHIPWNNHNFHTTSHPEVQSFVETDTGFIAHMADQTTIYYQWISETALHAQWELATWVTGKSGVCFYETLQELSVCIANI